MKAEFYRQILEKYSNVKFHENPFSGSRGVPCGQTDRHGEANKSLFAILRRRLTTTETIRKRVGCNNTCMVKFSSSFQQTLQISKTTQTYKPTNAWYKTQTIKMYKFRFKYFSTQCNVHDMHANYIPLYLINSANSWPAHCSTSNSRHNGEVRAT